MGLKDYINVPRIIGILLLAIALIGYSRLNALGLTILLFSAVVLLFSKKKNSDKALGSFVNSLKFNLDFLITIFIDAIYWVAILFTARFLGQYIQKEGIRLGVAGIQNLEPATGWELARTMMGLTLLLFIIWILILMVAYALTRTVIWSVIIKKKIKSLLKPFAIATLIWVPAWLAAFLLLNFALKQEVLAYVITAFLFLYVHLATLMHYFAAQNNSAIKGIKQAFSVGLGNIPKFALPYAFALVVYFVLVQVFNFIPAQGNTLLAASWLFILFYLAWFRGYAARIVKDIK